MIPRDDLEPAQRLLQDGSRQWPLFAEVDDRGPVHASSALPAVMKALGLDVRSPRRGHPAVVTARAFPCGLVIAG